MEDTQKKSFFLLSSRWGYNLVVGSLKKKLSCVSSFYIQNLNKHVRIMFVLGTNELLLMPKVSH